MRAKEFLIESNNDKAVTINIPITITIPASGGAPSIAAPAGTELPDEPVFVSPLQQELELRKQQGGKRSKVINQIVSDNGAESQLSDESAEKQAESKKNYYSLGEDFDQLMNEYNKTIITEQ
jgi:hypothetical protein